MNQLKATPGVWKQATGIGYCCIRTGSMNDKTGGVIADMRLVDGVYNPFDAHLIAAAPEMADYIKEKADSGCEKATDLWRKCCGEI